MMLNDLPLVHEEKDKTGPVGLSMYGEWGGGGGGGRRVERYEGCRERRGGGKGRNSTGWWGEGGTIWVIEGVRKREEGETHPRGKPGALILLPRLPPVALNFHKTFSMRIMSCKQDFLSHSTSPPPHRPSMVFLCTLHFGASSWLNSLLFCFSSRVLYTLIGNIESTNSGTDRGQGYHWFIIIYLHF